MGKERPVLAIAALTLGLVLAAVGLWRVLEERRAVDGSDAGLARPRDMAPGLAELHLQAASGRLKLRALKGLEMAFIAAGFPPEKPMPALTPRARLAGGAIAVAGQQTVSVAHYLAGDGRFTLFMVPADQEILPGDAAEVLRRGRRLRVVKREGVTLCFWRSGHWYFCLASQMRDADRDLLVDLVLAAQGE